MTPPLPEIEGLLTEPRRLHNGAVYPGRFTLHDPRWVVNSPIVSANATVTLRQLVDAALSNILWTDQEVQRGIKPESPEQTAVQLPLSAGYPDRRLYVFDPAKSDNIVEKLLSGRLPYLDPLLWNMRPGAFQAYWEEQAHQLHLYEGRIYLPDSHHRHQALVRALQIYRSAPGDYPSFDPDWQFSVNLYFVSRDQEKEYFYEKNVLGREPDHSKSYDLTEQDPLAVMAKQFVDKSPVLAANVNRVTDRLTDSNPQVVTLSTLHAMMETLAGTKAPSAQQIDELTEVAAAIYGALADVRPELGRLDIDARRRSRQASMAAQAVLMHGYAHLMAAYARPSEGEDPDAYRERFRVALEALGAEQEYRDPESGWTGDFFARDNPVWRRIGVLQQTRSGSWTVSNTRQTRDQSGRLLMERLGL